MQLQFFILNFTWHINILFSVATKFMYTCLPGICLLQMNDNTLREKYSRLNYFIIVLNPNYIFCRVLTRENSSSNARTMLLVTDIIVESNKRIISLTTQFKTIIFTRD